MSAEIEVLTVAETNRLTDLEGIVARGLDTFIEVGQALAEIRDSRLYRTQHWNFEYYCKEKWKMSASRARQLIGASQRARNIQSVTNVTPVREAVTRPLSQLSPKQQPAAWGRAVEKAGGNQPTQAQVQESVIEILDPACVPPMKNEKPIGTTMATVSDDAPAPKIKYIPALGLQTADNAIRILDTITTKDSERWSAGSRVVAWVAENLFNGKRPGDLAVCLGKMINVLMESEPTNRAKYIAEVAHRLPADERKMIVELIQGKEDGR